MGGRVSTWRIQGVRFAIVGVASNLVLYLFYLALTALGLGHKMAMTLLYAVGILQTFIFNKHWTFTHRGGTPRSLLRYLAAYGGCYGLNLVLLYVLVDRLGLPHAPVQGVAILGIALIVFLLQKYWVFAPSRIHPVGGEEMV
jgi:putative flippase GtrA